MTRLTHRDLAGLCAALYGSAGAAPVEWLYRSNPDATAVFGIVRIGPWLIVVYRGSYTGMDWLRDVLVKATDPAGRPSIKRVHSGFYGGTPEAADIVMMFYRKGDKLIIIGHSLGGARAEIGAEQAAALGVVPHLVVVWGQPAPFKPSTMPAPTYPLVSYRNVVGDEDPVTYATDIVGYRHRAAFSDLHALPAQSVYDPLERHHFALYQSATPDTEVLP